MKLTASSILYHVGNDIQLLSRTCIKRIFKEVVVINNPTFPMETIGNFHQNSVNESLPISPIPVEDSEPTQEEIDILLIPDDLIPPGVDDADSEDEVYVSKPNLDHHQITLHFQSIVSFFVKCKGHHFRHKASPFRAGGLYRDGIFISFNVFPTLMKTRIVIFFSICSPLRQLYSGASLSLRHIGTEYVQKSQKNSQETGHKRTRELDEFSDHEAKEIQASDLHVKNQSTSSFDL
ncbi:hypothetical protein Tco_0892759 [Tanacetum coccineum]|uniref:Uncharacterized protein n=1 Tax=Tanacetum coccineum TaxID=301880 RepID=A0ABQ5C8I8_9ASTR